MKSRKEGTRSRMEGTNRTVYIYLSWMCSDERYKYNETFEVLKMHWQVSSVCLMFDNSSSSSQPVFELQEQIEIHLNSTAMETLRHAWPTSLPILGAKWKIRPGPPQLQIIQQYSESKDSRGNYKQESDKWSWSRKDMHKFLTLTSTWSRKKGASYFNWSTGLFFILCCGS